VWGSNDRIRSGLRRDGRGILKEHLGVDMGLYMVRRVTVAGLTEFWRFSDKTGVT
jgi:hypothetical protein